MKRYCLYFQEMREKLFAFIPIHVAPYKNRELSMKHKKGLGRALLLLDFTLTHTKSWLIRLIKIDDTAAFAGFVVR